MKTLILPGYSLSNRVWAEEVKKAIKNSQIHKWLHWSDQNRRLDVKNEIKRINEEIGEEKINIIAKSIGTFILVTLLEESKNKINKLVLCGICKNDLDENELSKYNSLKNFDVNKILVIQNKEDRHGTFEEIKDFLAKINPEIRIIEKPGDTHDYPYFDEFSTFLGQ